MAGINIKKKIFNGLGKSSYFKGFFKNILDFSATKWSSWKSFDPGDPVTNGYIYRPYEKDYPLFIAQLIALRSGNKTTSGTYWTPGKFYIHIMHIKSTIEFYTNNKPSVSKNINTIITKDHIQSVRDIIIPQRSRYLLSSVIRQFTVPVWNLWLWDQLAEWLGLYHWRV